MSVEANHDRAAADGQPRSSVGDYYLLDQTLSEKERSIRDRVRSFGEREVLPISNDYWERAEFPLELVPKLAELRVAGTTIEGYGCPALSRLGAGVVSRELARADGSVNTFFGVHSGLAMGAIGLLGSEEQKARWLPPMAKLEKIGAFGLTEPHHGSDSVSLETTARRVGDEYVLNGAKRWIGNASFCRRHGDLGPRRPGGRRRLPGGEGHVGVRSLHGDNRQDRQARGLAGGDIAE